MRRRLGWAPSREKFRSRSVGGQAGTADFAGRFFADFLFYAIGQLDGILGMGSLVSSVRVFTIVSFVTPCDVCFFPPALFCFSDDCPVHPARRSRVCSA